MHPKFPDKLWSSIAESSYDCYKQKFLYDVQAEVFSSVKPLISVRESSKDDEKKSQSTSVIQSNHYPELTLKFFSAHSYRSASLSSAYNKGVSLHVILKARNWTNADIFLNHHYVHASDAPVGEIILNESPSED